MELLPEGVLLEPETYNALISTLRRDCRVLESFRIMDYSLLIGIHNLDMAAKEEVGEEIWLWFIYILGYAFNFYYSNLADIDLAFLLFYRIPPVCPVQHVLLLNSAHWKGQKRKSPNW